MTNETIELGFYCVACGNELDTEFRMDPKRYNRARIDVTPCKMCERNRPAEKKTRIDSPAPAISSETAAPMKKRGWPKGKPRGPRRKNIKKRASAE